MYPRLSDLLNSLLGTGIRLPIQTYGFFVALAFVIGGWILYLELKRKEKSGLIHAREKTVIKGKSATSGDLISSGLIGFVLGFKIFGIFLHYDEFVRSPQDYLLSWEGTWIPGILAAAVGVYLTYRSKQRTRLDKPVTTKILVHPCQLTPNIILVAAFFGIVGSKLFDLVEHLDDFARDPLGTLFSFSGLTFYGGLIAAAIAVFIYSERRGIPWPVIADSAAPGLMIAYGTGRIGCQLAGDGCWGVVNLQPKPGFLSFLPDRFWAFNYPGNVINEGSLMPGCGGEHCYILDQPVFPTPIYETLVALLFFAVLWSIRKRILIPGILFSIYLMLNGTGRFFIEKIRVNIRYPMMGIEVTQAEIIAVGLILAGFAGIIFFRRRYKTIHPPKT